VWIYVVSPFAGGALAALVSAVQHDAFEDSSVGEQTELRREALQG
jgi:hypothetical protein